MRKLFLLPFLMFLLFTHIAYSAHLNFTAYLTGDQEASSVTTNAKGTAALTLTGSGGLRYSITVSGLSGLITGAHIHLGSTKVNGPVIFDLSTSFSGTTAYGTIAGPLPDSIVAALMTGRMYINVHTAANPNGEIRGQVNLNAGTHLIARLDGAQQVPSVSTTSKGMAAITLGSVGSVGLAYNVTVNGLSGPIIGAHFHYGGIGETGPVVYDIASNFNNNSALGVWRSTGLNALNDSLIVALLTGKLYINVHTSANPNGEIRGQVLLASGFGVNSNLDGLSQVPPVVTTARGTAELTFTDYGLIYRLTYTGLSGLITGAHFHDGDSGATGPVVYDFASQVQNNTVTGVWKASNAGGDLNAALMKRLFTNGLYVNVHTSANPNGEIRGQLKMKPGSGIGGYLTGNQQTPPVTTTASGSVALYTVSTGLQYFITVNGLSGAITGAHFHYGGIGESGPVVKDIMMSFTGNTASGVWLTADPTQPFNDSLRQALVNGKIYINVHTAANPNGEIRAQLFLSAGTGMYSVLDGNQENPPVNTTASATASYTLTRGGLGFNITSNGLSGAITGAHFHYGYIGQNGPVVKDITANVSGNSLIGYWREVVAVDSLYNALLSGRIYINIHTGANPNGEIRSQVILREGMGLVAQLDGSQEVPPVNTTARGTGSGTITDAGIVFFNTFDGLSGPPSALHFHNAPAGSSGPVVRDLVSNLLGNSVLGAWKRTESVNPLTNLLIADAYSQSIYINLHTVVNPNGEIRGQYRTGALNPIGVEQISNEVPGVFSLSQNYPNPFNPNTKIKFAVPVASSVKLVVFDVLGREVSVLVNGQLKAGTYEADFDGFRYASGVYFYKIEAGSFTSIKKMVLVK